jgi:GTPase SAR1 family protein
VAKVLVANKVDKKDHKRKISTDQGEQLALKLKMPYFEVSAKSG